MVFVNRYCFLIQYRNKLCIFEKHCYSITCDSHQREKQNTIFLFTHLWPASSKALSHTFAFPPGLGASLLDNPKQCTDALERYVIQHHCKLIIATYGWFRQLEYDNYLMKWKYPLRDYLIEIQRLRGSGTLFLMEVWNRQQDSLKAWQFSDNRKLLYIWHFLCSPLITF